MTNNSKETERAELHKTIWRIANDLRGSVDGWDFKSYVLGMLFYRFISENLTGYLNEQERRCVFRTIVTGRSGNVTTDSGIVTTRSGIVTEDSLKGVEGCV